MKNIFRKRNLPFIERATADKRNADAQNDMYWRIRFEDGIDRHISMELLLLERAAHRGCVWSMTELARTYYYEGGKHTFPIALSWWDRAIRGGSEFARSELERISYEILHRITTFSDSPTKFNNLVMRCALLSEWCLTDMGRVDWGMLDDNERRRRICDLTARACDVLMLPPIQVSIVPGLTYTYPNGVTTVANGVAHPGGGIDIRAELVSDLSTLIPVLFHELGHHVCFVMRDNDDLRHSFMQTYGITNERIESWRRDDMGEEMTTSEEDADTLGYNVYACWAIAFL